MNLLSSLDFPANHQPHLAVIQAACESHTVADFTQAFASPPLLVPFLSPTVMITGQFSFDDAKHRSWHPELGMAHGMVESAYELTPWDMVESARPEIEKDRRWRGDER